MNFSQSKQTYITSIQIKKMKTYQQSQDFLMCPFLVNKLSQVVLLCTKSLRLTDRGTCIGLGICVVLLPIRYYISRFNFHSVLIHRLLYVLFLCLGWFSFCFPDSFCKSSTPPHLRLPTPSHDNFTLGLGWAFFL